MCEEESADDLSAIRTWEEAVDVLRAIRATKDRQSFRDLHEKMDRASREGELRSDRVVSRSSLQRVFTKGQQPKTSHLIGILYALDVPREQWNAWRDLVKRLQRPQQNEHDEALRTPCPREHAQMTRRLAGMQDELELLKDMLAGKHQAAAASNKLLLDKENELEDALQSLKETKAEYEKGAAQLREAEGVIQKLTAEARAARREIQAVRFDLGRAQIKLRNGDHDSQQRSTPVRLVRPYVSNLSQNEVHSQIAPPPGRDEPTAHGVDGERDERPPAQQVQKDHSATDQKPLD